MYPSMVPGGLHETVTSREPDLTLSPTHSSPAACKSLAPPPPTRATEPISRCRPDLLDCGLQLHTYIALPICTDFVQGPACIYGARGGAGFWMLLGVCCMY